MPLLTFDDYITCFRKQFIFQTGKGGRRISKYYTAKNQEQGLKNDQWAIMIFIYLGKLYGFSDLEILDELKVRKPLYEFLQEELLNILQPDYHDQKLHRKVVCKIGLVKNTISYTHRVDVELNVYSNQF